MLSSSIFTVVTMFIFIFLIQFDITNLPFPFKNTTLYNIWVCCTDFLFFSHISVFFSSTCPNICQDLSDAQQWRMAESIEYIGYIKHQHVSWTCFGEKNIIKKKSWFLLKSVRECDVMMHACTYDKIFLESHPAIRQICFNETMQVDNVSCKCIEFPPLEVEKLNPPSVFNAVRKICYWSGPCSFPCAVGLIDADRAQKHGMDEFISANPCSFDHASLFEMVQRLTLDHRLNDTFCSLVSGWLEQMCRHTDPRSNVTVGVCAGMVQSRPGVCLGRVLRSERSARLSQTPVLPAGPPGKSRAWGHYWPHPPSLQLCVLCLPCPWQQVCPDLYFQSFLNRKWVDVIIVTVFIRQKSLSFRPD